MSMMFGAFNPMEILPKKHYDSIRTIIDGVLDDVYNEYKAWGFKKKPSELLFGGPYPSKGQLGYQLLRPPHLGFLGEQWRIEGSTPNNWVDWQSGFTTDQCWIVLFGTFNLSVPPSIQALKFKIRDYTFLVNLQQGLTSFWLDKPLVLKPQTPTSIQIYSIDGKPNLFGLFGICIALEEYLSITDFNKYREEKRADRK